MALKKLSVEDLQRHCGVARSTVYRWLNGSSVPQGEAHVRLLELLRVDRDYNENPGPWNDPLIGSELNGCIVIVYEQDGHIIYSEPYVNPLWQDSIIHHNIIDYWCETPERFQMIQALVQGGVPLCLEHCHRHKNVVRASLGWVHHLKHKGLFKYQETWFEHCMLD